MWQFLKYWSNNVSFTFFKRASTQKNVNEMGHKTGVAKRIQDLQLILLTAVDTHSAYV